VKFTLYSEKTPAQCISALNERLQGRGGKYNLNGWTEKGGKFALSLETPIFSPPLPRVRRRTELRGIVEKEGGVTVIRGIVPDGVTPVGRVWVYGALFIAGIFIVLAKQLLVALMLIPLGVALYIPMKGDYVNCELLLNEVQRILKARYTPPTVSPASESGTARSAGRSSARGSTTRRSAGR